MGQGNKMKQNKAVMGKETVVTGDIFLSQGQQVLIRPLS